MEEKRKIELLLDHMNSEITNDCNDMFNCDYHLLEESTTDGYEVFVFKQPEEEVILCENVYYYNHDLGEQVVETLMCGNTVVFVDDYDYKDLYIHDALLEKFEEFVDDILQDETLPVNEVKELIKEYGIDIEL